jgi:hypothetical protein
MQLTNKPSCFQFKLEKVKCGVTNNISLLKQIIFFFRKYFTMQLHRTTSYYIRIKIKRNEHIQSLSAPKT